MSINNLILLGLLILAVFVGWFIYDSTQPLEPHTPYPYTIVSASNMIYLLDKRSGATWYRGGGFKWRPFTFEPSKTSTVVEFGEVVEEEQAFTPPKELDLSGFDATDNAQSAEPTTELNLSGFDDDLPFFIAPKSDLAH